MSGCKHPWKYLGHTQGKDFASGRSTELVDWCIDWCPTCGTVRETERHGSRVQYRYPKSVKRKS